LTIEQSGKSTIRVQHGEMTFEYHPIKWVFEAVGGKNEPEARKNGVDGT
jgi:hypothetical protein